MAEPVAAAPVARSWSEPRRLPARVAVGALAAGGLAAVLVPGARAGLGLALAALALLAAATAGVGGWRADPWRLCCLAVAVVLALVSLYRDAAWLVAGDLAVAFVLTALALTGPRTIASALTVPVAALARMFAGPAAVLRGALDAAPRPVAGSTGPALRGVLLAVVLVAVFGSLFASADGAFAQLVDELAPRQSLVDWLPERFAVGLLVVALAGGLALVARGDGDRAAPGSPPRSTLGPTEWGIALGALVALFTAFVAVQFVVLFGGERHVLETAGLTYADYAHQGFGQLLVAAALVIGVVVGAWRWSRVETPAQRLLLRILLSVLCALTLVVVAAALHRLDIYADAFGATRLRLLAGVVCAWVGALLVLVGLAAVTDGRRFVARAAVALSAAFVVGMTLANPDALIAERNVDRFQAQGKIDVAYNASLSADATPALTQLPPELADRVLARQRLRLEAGEGVRSWNLARERAREALGAPPS